MLAPEYRTRYDEQIEVADMRSNIFNSTEGILFAGYWTEYWEILVKSWYPFRSPPQRKHNTYLRVICARAHIHTRPDIWLEILGFNMNAAIYVERIGMEVIAQECRQYR